jgi:hypothetical protein
VLRVGTATVRAAARSLAAAARALATVLGDIYVVQSKGEARARRRVRLHAVVPADASLRQRDLFYAAHALRACARRSQAVFDPSSHIVYTVARATARKLEAVRRLRRCRGHCAPC